MILQSRDNTKSSVFTSPRGFLRGLHRTSKMSRSPSPTLMSPTSASPLSTPRSVSPASTTSSTELGDGHSQRTRTGPFHKAQNFVLNNPVIQQVQCGAHLNPTLEQLSRHIMPRASFDCAAEDPPPRCYPGTRCCIIDKATEYFRLPDRAKNILWFSGPAGVGKTAIMRTLADAEAASKRLGAAIFFSKHRQSKRASVRGFVPTLAYQLAVEIPLYQAFVTKKLTADPQLLEKGMEGLFQALIVEPFGSQVLCEDLGRRLILIDGLDECNGGEHAQQEIVKMIGDFVRQHPTSPLVWVIASRPEPHLRAAFSHPSITPNCRHEHIAIDTPEARKDVEVYLQSEFAEMRRRFAPLIPEGEEWPSKPQVVLIVRAASGLFIFASTVVRFIGDPKIGNPVKQLKSVIHAIEKYRDSPRSPNDNPLASLHSLYLEILKTIPPPTYAQLTGRILGCCDLLPRNTVHPTSFMLSCNFLGLKQSDAYASLQRLHSVLDIPSPGEEAATREIRVLHSSFTDFLRNRSASREFYIGRTETAADIARCSFRILQEVNSDADPSPRVSNISLSWGHDRPEHTREKLLKTAYDGFRLMTVPVLDRGFDVSFTLAERIALLSQADFSKLDCYLTPDIKTSVYDTRAHHQCLFDWLLNQWKSTPEAFQKSGPVKEIPLKHLDKRSIRTDRAVIHFMFTGEDGSVVRPKVYSDHKEIREKYRGDTLEAFNQVLRPYRRGSPSSQIQIWGKDPAKTCLLFERKSAPDHYVDGNLIVKEMFFIPYSPRKK